METKIYSIGTKFKRVGRKNAQIETVVDILKTYNNNNELVQVRYVAAHSFMLQTVLDRDVIGTTIARGLITE